MTSFNKHVIVVGSARSATSWLAELLARPYRYRLLFEPEHEFQTTKGHLLVDKWIQNSDEAGEGHLYLRKVFQNKVDNDWIAQHSNRKWKRHLWPWIPKRFVIKFVRCNLAAAYMNEAFGIPVIHVIRDPYEVIASQQRVRFPWLFDLSHFEDQKELVDRIKKEFGYDISNWRKQSSEEILALRWCLENCIPLSEGRIQKLKNYKIVSHQQLRANPNLFREITKEISFETIDDLESRYVKPSSKAHSKGLTGNHDKEEVVKLRENESVSNILNTFRYQEFLKALF